MEINYDVPPRRTAATQHRAAEAADPDAKTRGPKAHGLRTARGKKKTKRAGGRVEWPPYRQDP